MFSSRWKKYFLVRFQVENLLSIPSCWKLDRQTDTYTQTRRHTYTLPFQYIIVRYSVDGSVWSASSGCSWIFMCPKIEKWWWTSIGVIIFILTTLTSYVEWCYSLFPKTIFKLCVCFSFQKIKIIDISGNIEAWRKMEKKHIDLTIHTGKINNDSCFGIGTIFYIGFKKFDFWLFWVLFGRQ